MVAGEGQELNLLHEEGTGAREPLPGPCSLLSVPNNSNFPVQTSSCSALTSPLHPCWAGPAEGLEQDVMGGAADAPQG